ncbi:MAG: SPOR domain-containing protein [Bacteroidetes bacterium]|nr:MAG: SPOR domain-containing protein [Bacteroidota bacterium]
MITVEQLIGDLLLKHNCVIVPSFGGFVASRKPAVIDHATGMITPPKKKLLFNRQLLNNDGLLISECSVRNTLSYERSESYISDTVAFWNESLKRGERVEIERVGHLYFDQEKNLCFEQDRFFNLLLESYGLGSVRFVSEADVKANETLTEEKLAPIKEISFDKVVQPVQNEKPGIIEHPAVKESRKVWKYVAAACLLPIAFYSFWIPMKTDVLESGMISVRDFNPFNTVVTSVYQKKEQVLESIPADPETLEEKIEKLDKDVEVFSYEFDDDLYIPVRIPKTNTPEVTNTEVENTTVSSQGNFDLIVGCFGDENNAKNLVAKLKSEGFEAYIVDVSNNLSRVSAGNANDQDAISQLNQKVSAAGYTGWVLKH